MVQGIGNNPTNPPYGSKFTGLNGNSSFSNNDTITLFGNSNRDKMNEVSKWIDGGFANENKPESVGDTVSYLNDDGSSYELNLNMHTITQYDKDGNKLISRAMTAEERAMSAEDLYEHLSAVPNDNPTTETKKTSENFNPVTAAPQNTEEEPVYLQKDSTYQKYKNGLKKIEDKLSAIENKYDIKRGGTLPITANLDDKGDYNLLLSKFNRIKKDLVEYKNEMSNWQDGPLPKESFIKRGNTQFTNLERITLKDGQRAWKSAQGVFYPYMDGKIGGAEVPSDLIP